MRTTKIIIKNLYGITEKQLDGRSVELTGTNGTGKTSVLDAIRYALTNDSERDYIIKDGSSEGEILIETDTGLSINRKKREGKSDFKKVSENRRDVQSPESFLRTLFTPLQLDPVAFTQLSKQEQNRLILDLIEFDWDMGWIQDQFGEIPEGVDYSANILEVLNQIQSEKGAYFQRRQDINRDIRNKRAFVSDIAEGIPANYQAEKWREYDLVAKSTELSKADELNARIQRARLFEDSYKGKLREIEADYQLQKTNAERQISDRKSELTAEIERKMAEIKAAQNEIDGLNETLADKISVARSAMDAKKAQLDKDMSVAADYAGKEPVDVTELREEISTAQGMIKLLREYDRMRAMEKDIAYLSDRSEDLTAKIEKARNLPGEILKQATIPVKGLTVENGIPLINGLPISNLSEGEKLELCVDVTISNPSALQIILIDGAEKLSDENRQKLYAKCKEKGLQFIATRTTNDSELEVTEL